MDDLTREQTKAHGTKVTKDQATAHFDHVYRVFVNTGRIPSAPRARPVGPFLWASDGRPESSGPVFERRTTIPARVLLKADVGWRWRAVDA